MKPKVFGITTSCSGATMLAAADVCRHFLEGKCSYGQNLRDRRDDAWGCGRCWQHSGAIWVSKITKWGAKEPLKVSRILSLSWKKGLIASQPWYHSDYSRPSPNPWDDWWLLVGVRIDFAGPWTHYLIVLRSGPCATTLRAVTVSWVSWMIGS